MEKTNPTTLSVGCYELNIKTLRLICHRADGSRTEQALSFRECSMLQLLILNLDEIVENERFRNELWENTYLFSDASLYVFISHLRRYLSADPRITIINLRGRGYRMTFQQQQP
ncbi:MAG: helix-turn-helix domain-containing protein [Prevotella sp.]|nr:helix-turn-helix domain-containing protein [Prevotella sp.]